MNIPVEISNAGKYAGRKNSINEAVRTIVMKIVEDEKIASYEDFEAYLEKENIPKVKLKEVSGRSRSTVIINGKKIRCC